MKCPTLFLVVAFLTVLTSCSSTPLPEATSPTSKPAETLSLTPTWTGQPTLSPTASPTATSTAIPATPTPTSPLPTSTPAVVVMELTEQELAEHFKAWIENAGLSTETVLVKLANGKMEVLMTNVGIPIYMIQEFKMVGTYATIHGRLQFQLEEAAPDAPWVSVITPTADEVMAGVTEGIHITDVKIADGKMIVSGLNVSS